VLVIESEADQVKDLDASFHYQLYTPTTQKVTDLIAVQPSREAALGYSSMISQINNLQVGVALVAQNGIDTALEIGGILPTAEVVLTVTLVDGEKYSGSTTLGGSEPGQKALFPSELINSLPKSFESARLSVTALEPIYLTLLGVGSPPTYEDVQIGVAPAQVTKAAASELDKLSSTWEMSIRTTSNTCGFENGDPSTEPIRMVWCSQQFTVIPLPLDGLWGSGVIDGNSIAFAGMEADLEDESCPLILHSSGKGLVAKDRIDGTLSTSVSGESTICGDIPGCVINAEFTMTKSYDSPCFERAYFEMNPANSDYILPYPTGKAYPLNQTYCGPPSGHHNQLAYDFLIPIGNEVVAARSGVVRALREDSPDDGQGSQHNHVLIEHADGTVGFYAHLKQSGVLVEVGDDVTAGQLIAYSGHSGTTDVPHLHFGVYQDYPPIEGQDIPITFGNAPGPTDCRGGLIPGETYQAVPQ
jgi:hypothetical protein